jgi:1,4-alpha-glucan branching enzyme
MRRQTLMLNNSRVIALLFLLLLSGCAAKHSGPEVRDGAVRFEFIAPKASSVAVAGSFNRWDPRKNLLSGPNRSGKWSVTLELAPGRYEYLFVVNGNTWLPDPGAPSVDDGLGGRNSVVEVGR